MDLAVFVGRASEVPQVRAVLDQSRLVTLTGAGGSGKTRLALEVVSRRSPDDTVIWVELAGLDDAALLAQHVAEGAGFPDEIRTPAALASLLSGGPLLLVLDNCEHLVDACARLAGEILAACPDLRILATSREALGVRGERAWLVPPLELPDPDAAVDAIAGAEAVRLFMERARDVVPSFRLTPANAAAVAGICRAVDGIPLAIELAAARVRVLAPGQILERLGASLDLLSSGKRDTLPRQRTLRATLDWSHDLLDDGGRRLLRRLAVFRGGATLDSVEDVCAGAETEEALLDTLASLVDRSLVAVREAEGEARYALLEIVRQYALEYLEASGEAEEVRGRHARHFAALVEEAEPHLTRPTRPPWIHRLNLELDNLREVLAWTRRHAPEEHIALLGRLWWFWFSTRHWAEGGRWIADALALPAAAGAGRPRAALLFAQGALFALQARTHEPRPFLEEAAELARAAGDERLEAYALNYLGMTWAGEGREEASAYCRRAEAWFRAHGDLYGLRLALLLQGSAAMGQGRLEDAERLNREGVEVARRFGLERELAIALQNLAAVRLRAGEHAEAEALVLEGLAASRRDPSYYFICVGLFYLAEAVGHRGDPLRAARLLGAAEALAESIGMSFFTQDRERMASALPLFRESAGAEAFEEARTAGRGVALDDLLDEACKGTTTPAPGPAAPLPSGTQGTTGLELRLLGGFQARVDGEPVPAGSWTYSKPRELLALLGSRPGGATRDQVGALLWPDAPPSRLKNSFHVTLHHLRKALQRPDWIAQEGERYRIRSEVAVHVDARTFEAAAERALAEARAWSPDPEGAVAPAPPLQAVEEALAAYAGDLLEGEVVGAWAEDWRDRLRRLAVELHLVLGRLHEDAHRFGPAVEAYGAAVVREPLSEEAHRGLMRCWAAGGERARALAHYDALVAQLRERLDVDPDPETEALARALRQGS